MPDEAELLIRAKLAMPREQPADATPGVMLTLLCNVCLEPYQRVPRTEAELEYIRRERHICNNQFRVAICDGCLSSHHRAITPQREFHDTPNFLLRHQARFGVEGNGG